MKFLKVGRVAIITRGRYAGKKVRYSFPLSDRSFEAANIQVAAITVLSLKFKEEA